MNLMYDTELRELLELVFHDRISGVELRTHSQD